MALSYLQQTRSVTKAGILETFFYDADSNLTSDGHWSYTWDAENRLVSLAPVTNVGPQISLQFEYDWQGRRIHKQVWDDTGCDGAPTNDVKFVCDGWNLVAELNATNNAVIRSYVWGSDLSGTMQGAGGVGGLLFLRNCESPIGYYAPAYDGNGNITALLSMSGGTNSATYEYGPFGEVIRATGPIAKGNPFRFSTKYQDDQADLLYFGYKFYNHSLGRWLSRDPEGDLESSGDRPRTVQSYFNETSQYCFVNNDALTYSDALGLYALPRPYFDCSINRGPCATYICVVYGFGPGKKPDPAALRFCVGFRKSRLAKAPAAGNGAAYHNECINLDQCYKWYAP